MEEKLNDQEIIRREKLKKLEELGVNPRGERFDRTDTTKSAREKSNGKTNEELDAEHVYVKLAGRIMSLRKMGKASFLNIQDKFGKIQGYISIDTVGQNEYEIFKICDIGDIVGLYGRLMLTRTGELTIRVEEFTFLTKSLRVLPEKFHGLTDVEERYRHRYVDLIMNEEAKNVALLRPKILRSMQRYFDNLGFVEVETSVLSPILGGANARPFVTHHNTLNKDFYLRIATELPLKRLIVGGLEKVYEFGRLFRNEGMDIKHNPEFTTVELYEAYGDLQSMREICEGVIRNTCQEVLGTTKITYLDKEIDFTPEFRWVSMSELVKEKTGVDFTSNITLEEAQELVSKYGIKIEKHWTSTGYYLNALFEELCEEDLIQPTFVYGHPIEISPLTKKGKDPRFTERFELYINATEYANAYSELNDPIDQKERFIAQLKAKELGDDEANEMDNDFIEALEYGMPPTGGIGIGFDRFVMLLTNQKSIREVILFPTMKSLGGVKSENGVNSKEVSTPNSEPEKIDFSNVKIEPLFEEMVDFDTFSKSDFRAVKVKECVAVPKSKKLLQFTLDDGTGTDRTILSGIHAYYEPEELVGKTLIAITNLPPRAMMGIDSCGMLLSAIHEEEGEEKLHLLMVDDHIPAGAKLY